MERRSLNMARSFDVHKKNSLLQTKICSYLNMYQKWLNELRQPSIKSSFCEVHQEQCMLRLASHAIAPSFGFGSVRV